MARPHPAGFMLKARILRMQFALAVAATCFFLPAVGQLKANFSSNITEGCAPLIVRFQDQSTGGAVAYQWYLGNNITPHDEKDPSTTYLTPGIYSVKLIVRNASNTVDSAVKVDYIKVYATPTVNLRASDSTGCFPIQIAFTDLSTPGDGQISKRLWDFGDGNTSDLANPVHRYTAMGNYNVTLRVTNSHGCDKTLSKLEYIRLTSGVKADFDFSAPNTCRAPTPVTFVNRSTGTGTLFYTWSFGDQVSSTLRDPAHTYTAGGSYDITLVVANNAGCRDTMRKENAINVGTVKADFTIPAVVCEETPFSLTNTSQPGAFGSTWDFGDGTSSGSFNASKSYPAPGTYRVKLTSNFGSCTDTLSKVITVLPKPVASFTAAQTSSCQLPFSVTFQNNSSLASGYRWDFGDGTSSIEANPMHTYTRSGSFTVTLTATGANGCQSVNTSYGFIRAEPLRLSLSNLPSEGCAPHRFKPLLQITSVEPVASVHWDFGDGSTSSLPAPEHVYPAPGTYRIKVVVKTTGGCSDSLEVPAAVRVGDQPAISFITSASQACAFKPIQFTDNTSGGLIRDWFWEFGDGSYSTARNPVHTYTDTGRYNVSLSVNNNGCHSTLRMDHAVTILPPIARFTIGQGSCSDRFRRQFKDASVGAKSWSWNFGDGSTSTEKDPEHLYTKTGAYEVTLTVRTDSCEHTIKKTIAVINETPDFSTQDTVACKNQPVRFVMRANGENIDNVLWSYGDGYTFRDYYDNASHTYATADTFTVRAVFSDNNGCRDTVTKTNYVIIKGPSADFQLSKTVFCRDAAVPFEDRSVAGASSPIRQWIWQFGDSQIDTLQAPPFTHAYGATGFFYARLKVLDADGCSDVSAYKGLSISKPRAAFYSPDSLSCANKPIRFINQSSGSQVRYAWDFGDGSLASTNFQPTHQYGAENNYDVRLIATDQYGCQDSMTRAGYVRVLNPKASFTVTDSVSTCPPLFTVFQNTSSHFVGYQWDFGDKTSSAIDNPTHFYNYPGIYLARLIVTSKGGCQDTSERKMTVRGPQGEFFYEETKACVPSTIRFMGTSKDEVTFVWDFNDGNTQMTADSSISYTYKVPGLYFPKMILVDPQGCKVPIAGPHPLDLKGASARFAVSATTVCDSGLVRLRDESISNEAITSYQWNFGDGSGSTEQHPGHTYRTPGNYPLHLVVTTETGCRDTADVTHTVNVAERPVIAIKGDTALCAPARFQLAGDVIRQDSTGLKWLWKTGIFGTDTSARVSLRYPNPGQYQASLVATSGWGCADTAVHTMIVHPKPDVDAGRDIVVCLGSSFALAGTGADNYRWSPATYLSCTDCGQPAGKPLDNQIYHLTGRTEFGCEATDSVFVRVKKPFRLTVPESDTLCVGSATALWASGGEIYRWSPATGLSDPNIAAPVARPTQSTTYQVVGMDSALCFYDTATVSVAVYPFPVVHAGDDKSILVGNGVPLDGTFSTDVNRIRWNPASGLNCTDCPQPVASPKRTTAYTVEVTNQGGCSAADEVTVTVLCNQGNLFIPNTFSPNGDGSNDIFYPRGKGVFGIRSLRIFNRWGEEVFQRSNFQANDIHQGWNGKFRGKDVTQDVYVYTIEIVCENNTVLSFKGNVTLLR